jgi:hypothetical protein
MAGQDAGVLRVQVGRRVARNLVKEKLREVREDRLRLVPYFLFNYKAELLVDGRLDAETHEGLVGIDASTKRALEWHFGIETAPLSEQDVEVERKSVRIDQAAARQVLLKHVGALVGREVTTEEQSDEWSMVVRKRVRLAGDEISVRFLGLYWLPVWRLAGPGGSIEIEAASGETVEEDVLVEQSDSQLI